MTEFKIGDRVKVVGPLRGAHGLKGEVGYIDKMYKDEKLYYVIEDEGYEYSGDIYKVNDEWYGEDALELSYTPKDIKELDPDGGPAEYYDFPSGAITLNDLIEFKNMDFHRGNIFKGCWRYGEKPGVTKEYDARKIIYSGARLLKQLVGVEELRKTLQKMLDDPQFKEN